MYQVDSRLNGWMNEQVILLQTWSGLTCTRLKKKKFSIFYGAWDKTWAGVYGE